MVPDPLSLLAFFLFFAAALLLTIRRAAYGFAILIVSAPFALYQIVGNTTVTVMKTALVAVALGLFVRPGIFRSLRDERVRPMLIGLAAVLFATAISYFQARYHGPVLRETLKVVEYACVFALAYCAYRADPDVILLRRVTMLISLIVCAIALTQEIYGAPSALLMNGHVTPRIAGPLEGPNQLAGYFDITIPILLAFAVQRTNVQVLFTLFVVIVTDVLTFSRGGAIGAVVGIVVMALLYRRSLWRAIAAICAGGVAGGIAATVWGVIAHTFSLARFWDIEPSTYAGGVGTRPELWRAAVVLWREHPLLGIGAGNFELEVARTGVHGVSGVHTHANSLYLQSLVEGGIPLLAANVLLLGWTMIALFRRAARSPLTAAAFAATAAFAAHQTVDLIVFYPKIGGWWWIVLALGAADG